MSFIIHCPKCGATIESLHEVRFSMASYMLTVIEEKNEARDLGIEFSDEIKDYLDEEINWIWNMTAKKVSEIFEKKNNTNNVFIFELKGDKIIKIFGDEALKSYKKYQNEDNPILKEEIKNEIVEKIRNSFEQETLVRKVFSNSDNVNNIENLIDYANDDKTLFKAEVGFQFFKDNDNNVFANGIEAYEIANQRSYRISVKEKRCPYCSGTLSPYVGQYEEKVICFFGSTTSAKTTLLVACIKKIKDIQNRNINNYISNVRLQRIHELQEVKDFEEKCYEPYIYGFAPQKTNEDWFPQVSIPLKIEEKEYLYTFVDVPGEALVNKEEKYDEANFKRNRLIFTSADIILLCVAAEQLYDTRSEVINENEIQASANINTVVRNFADCAEIFANEEMTTKPAICILVTKSDKMENVNEWSKNEKDIITGIAPLIQNMSDTTCFQYAKYNNYSINVREMLKKVENSGGLINTVSDIFESGVQYALVAPFGRHAIGYSAKTAIEKLKEIFESNETYNGATWLKQEIFKNDWNNDIGDSRYEEIDSNDKLKNEIKKLHSEYNPVKEVGVENILLWILAYTELMPICEYSDLNKTFNKIEFNDNNRTLVKEALSAPDFNRQIGSNDTQIKKHWKKRKMK